MNKEELKKNLEHCIQLLSIEGKDTKNQAKFLLEELVEELDNECNKSK